MIKLQGIGYTVLLLLAIASAVGVRDSVSAELIENSSSTLTFSFATPGDLTVSYGSVRSMVWSRVGRLVLYEARVQFTPTFTTSTGVAHFTGAPFSPVSGVVAYLATVAYVTTAPTLPAGYTQHAARLMQSNSQLQLQRSGSNVVTTNLNATEMTSGATYDVRISGVYQVLYTFDGNIYPTYDAILEDEVDDVITAIDTMTINSTNETTQLALLILVCAMAIAMFFGFKTGLTR